MLPPAVCSVAYTNNNDLARARDSTAGKRSLVAVASESSPATCNRHRRGAKSVGITLHRTPLR